MSYLKPTKWYLADAEARSRASAMFQIPTADERSLLVKGDCAKLIFENEEPDHACVGERMWVRVTTSLGDGRYIGVLESHPVVVDGIEHGNAVEFEAKHVCDVERKA